MSAINTNSPDYYYDRSSYCEYSGSPECPRNCPICTIPYDKDEANGIGNIEAPKVGSFIGWKIIKLEQAELVKREYESEEFDMFWFQPKYYYQPLRNFMLPNGIAKQFTYALAKLLITEDAERSSAYGTKCRCSEAVVLEIHPIDGYTGEVYEDLDAGYGYSTWNDEFEYEVGKVIRPTAEFDERWWEECASGIHFFMTKEKAINYLNELV